MNDIISGFLRRLNGNRNRRSTAVSEISEIPQNLHYQQSA